MPKIELYNGDCLEIMNSLIEKGIKVDAVITDPPFGTTACAWDVVIPFDKMWECLNALTDTTSAIVLFGIEPFSSALRMSNIKNYKNDWIWEKSRPSGINLKNQPMRKHETISVFAKGKIDTFNPIMEAKEANGQISTRKPWATWNTGKSEHLKGKTNKKICNEKRKPTSILKFPSVSNFPKNLHPTQKPLALMEYLIKTYTNEGETVLDFTMGSGTTGCACKELNRNFIGIEKDENYFKIAEERINNHKGDIRRKLI